MSLPHAIMTFQLTNHEGMKCHIYFVYNVSALLSTMDFIYQSTWQLSFQKVISINVSYVAMRPRTDTYDMLCQLLKFSMDFFATSINTFEPRGRYISCICLC